MIKEFWQEQREEKKRQKQLKKENKKKSRTKEQIAYKVFGIIFAIFLVVGSIGYSCSTVGGFGDYSWDSLIGITDEMKEALTASVDRNLILKECVLTDNDWQDAQEILANNGITMVQDGELAEDYEGDAITSDMVMPKMALGSLISKLIGSIGTNNNYELLSFKLYLDGGDLYLNTVCMVNLSAVVTGSTLPIVYVNTSSRLRYMSDKICSLNPEYKINLIEDKLNKDILDVIKNSKFAGDLDSFTNTNVVGYIELFAAMIGADAKIVDDNILFESKLSK